MIHRMFAAVGRSIPSKQLLCSYRISQPLVGASAGTAAVFVPDVRSCMSGRAASTAAVFVPDVRSYLLEQAANAAALLVPDVRGGLPKHSANAVAVYRTRCSQLFVGALR